MSSTHVGNWAWATAVHIPKQNKACRIHMSMKVRHLGALM